MLILRYGSDVSLSISLGDSGVLSMFLSSLVFFAMTLVVVLMFVVIYISVEAILVEDIHDRFIVSILISSLLFFYIIFGPSLSLELLVID